MDINYFIIGVLIFLGCLVLVYGLWRKRKRTKSVVGKTVISPVNHWLKGERLMLLLQKAGFTRKEDESDWGFRKRIFPELYKRNSSWAMTILMGASPTEWDDVDQAIYGSLLAKWSPTHNQLVRFAEGFGGDLDPLLMREERAASST